MDEKIDIVIAWVDGNDPAWRKEKAQYQPDKKNDAGINRYRDWGQLRYWFRGVEKYAPWVNKIHFVTWGHVPDFLDVNHPKVHIVKHEDYLPAEYRPTFSSRPIELNFHRIPDLAEHFIYFNDDFLFFHKTKETDFFRNGKPCTFAALNAISLCGYNDYAGITVNNVAIINKHFQKKAVLKHHLGKWLKWRYGAKILMHTLTMLPYPRFTGFYEPHAANSFLKSTFEKVWAAEPELLDNVSKHKFRNNREDVNQWLMREWQLCENNFVPRRTSFDSYCDLTKDTKFDRWLKIKNKIKIVCFNDSFVGDEREFQETQERFLAMLEKKFPEKSSFEL